MGHLGDMQQTSYRITAFLGPGGGAKKTCPPWLNSCVRACPSTMEMSTPPPHFHQIILYYPHSYLSEFLPSKQNSFILLSNPFIVVSRSFRHPYNLRIQNSSIHTTLEYKIQASIQPQNTKFKHPYKLEYKIQAFINLRIQNSRIHTKFKHPYNLRI